VSTDSAEAKGPQRGLALDGVRVLEAGSLLAGPFCGQLLGDFGAEVIKVEPPITGDPMRDWGQAEVDGQSLWWPILSRNKKWWPILSRNKKSVVLDLRSRAGQEAFRRLAAISDIVVENFRAGTLERWNLGYDQLQARHPGLVLVRVTGFGQTGPYASRPGYAAIAEAMGGLRHLVGYPDRPPTRVGVSIGDTIAGLFAALGAMVALHERASSGRGQVVDCALYEAVLACMESLVPEYAVAGHIRERSGPVLKNVAPSNVYPTSDGQLVIAANQDTLFRRLCGVMGRLDLVEDQRFATHIARGKHQEDLDKIIGAWTERFRTADLAARLEDAAVAVGPIYRAAEMLQDEHFAARSAIVTVPVDGFGAFPMQNVVPKLSRTPGAVRSAGLPLGAHDTEVLNGLLHMTASEIGAAQGPVRKAHD
jgi:formyl-CoA transferase